MTGLSFIIGGNSKAFSLRKTTQKKIKRAPKIVLHSYVYILSPAVVNSCQQTSFNRGRMLQNVKVKNRKHETTIHQSISLSAFCCYVNNKLGAAQGCSMLLKVVIHTMVGHAMCELS